MRKILTIALTFLAIICLTSCGRNTPEGSLKSILSDMKNGDTEKFNNILKNCKKDDIDPILEDDAVFLTLLGKMEYEIKNPTINKDSAFVPVSIKTIDMKKIAWSYLKQSIFLKKIGMKKLG